MAMTKTEIQARYDSKNTRRYAMKLNLATDADIIEKLSSVDSIQGYIKRLIRQDIASPVPDFKPDNWDYIVSLMDDEIRETVHERLSPCSAYVFLAEYQKRHKEKYGEDFKY